MIEEENHKDTKDTKKDFKSLCLCVFVVFSRLLLSNYSIKRAVMKATVNQEPVSDLLLI
jgi:hypothetical protein